MGAPVAEGRQRDDTNRRNRQQELTAHDDAFTAPASEVIVNVRIPAGEARRTLAFATLPFGADQKADPKGNGEILGSLGR